MSTTIFHYLNTTYSGDLALSGLRYMVLATFSCMKRDNPVSFDHPYLYPQNHGSVWFV